jgi:hypothetical protein
MICGSYTRMPKYRGKRLARRFALDGSGRGDMRRHGGALQAANRSYATVLDASLSAVSKSAGFSS